MNVRCPVCGAAVQLAVGDTRLACTSCGLAAPVSSVGTAPGTHAMLALESDLTGTTLAGRALIERIGAGGMGTVYRARADGADVAVKVLRPGLGADRAAMLVRFAREAEAMRRLEHPRVVRFLDHGEVGDIAYIVTELVEGRDLAAQLAAGRMSLAEIVDVFGQMCDGVSAAHAAGIVHRDLKPANILVGKDGVKVADFGLAQLGADVTVPTLTRTDVAMGTFHYLAPEQRKDARNVDHRADVWALGVILYEMLTGELPLGSFAPPSMTGPAGCDRRADAIVRRALAPDPAERYATVDELARAVRALASRPRVAQRWVALAAAIAVVGGTTTAVAFALSPDDEPKPVAVMTSDASIDGVMLAEIDALMEGSPIAIVPADAPVDAALVAVVPVAPIDLVAAAPGSGATPPRRRPTPPKPGGVDKVGKPVKTDGGKTKKRVDEDIVRTPASCTSARRCCIAVKGSDCGSWLTADAAACTTALDDFRARATNAKQLASCGVRKGKGK
jgi:hypothetical protein